MIISTGLTICPQLLMELWSSAIDVQCMGKSVSDSNPLVSLSNPALHLGLAERYSERSDHH